jgi:hypothetical protein
MEDAALGRKVSHRMKSTARRFHHDDRGTLFGRCCAAVTHGEGFRRKSRGLHITVAFDGKCDAHIDTHPFIMADGWRDRLDERMERQVVMGGCSIVKIFSASQNGGVLRGAILIASPCPAWRTPCKRS